MATRENGWTGGFVGFAGMMLILIGSFHAFAGLAAIFEDDYFVVTRNYLYDIDVTVWGWLHLILGIFAIIAGFNIYSGASWGRVVGMTFAVVSAIGNFFFIPYEPVWAILIIALDVLVIAALSTYTPGGARMRA